MVGVGNSEFGATVAFHCFFDCLVRGHGDDARQLETAVAALGQASFPANIFQLPVDVVTIEIADFGLGNIAFHDVVVQTLFLFVAQFHRLVLAAEEMEFVGGADAATMDVDATVENVHAP